MGKKNRRKVLLRQLTKLSIDLAIFVFSFLVSFTLVNKGSNFGSLFTPIWIVPAFMLIRLLLSHGFRLQSTIWRYSSVSDLMRIIISNTIGSGIIALVTASVSVISLPILVLFLDWLLVIFLVGGSRLAIRRVFEQYFEKDRKDLEKRSVLVYGAGRAGELLLRNIKNKNNSKIIVVGILDDDPMKRGHRIHNVPVLGNGHEVRKLVAEHDIDDIYFAISAISGHETRNLLKLIKDQVGSDVQVKTIPGLKDLVNGRVSVNQLRQIEIKDLLRRAPIELDKTPVSEMVRDRRVLVVGGGGSIGSELCNQIAQYKPSQLIIVDSSEFNLYQVEAALKESFPDLLLTCVVLDAGNEPLMRRIFSKYYPEHIFHAAAYKHVPLMENNPHSAIYNNLKSTLVLAELANEFKVERFVLISTDKAVQPTNVMGATKRVCELITLLISRHSTTKFMAVRFGNVLGSSGSVIPKFRQQIERGGPLTVTHPEITRYFMLISEAVELVLQVGSVGENGNIYVLDMGDPVKINDLAKYMIQLSGLEVDEDIEIHYTGLRPGEKMYESLFLEGEECSTDIPGIMMLRPHLTQNGDFIPRVRNFISSCPAKDNVQLRLELKTFVPEYVPQDEMLSKEEKLMLATALKEVTTKRVEVA